MSHVFRVFMAVACHSDRFMCQTVAKQRNNPGSRSLHARLKSVMVATLSDEKIQD
jgi:hypothetical protein